MYRFSAVPVKIPTSYFLDIGKVILKSIWKGIGPGITNTRSKNKVEDQTLIRAQDLP